MVEDFVVNMATRETQRTHVKGFKFYLGHHTVHGALSARGNDKKH